jgi:hypothetical protein
MTPDQFRVSPEAEDLPKSRSPVTRNACDAFICKVFRCEGDQLTVFPGAGIAGKLLPSEIPSKSFAWVSEAKNMALHQP